MSPFDPKPTDYTELLKVFLEGLKHGIIDKQEVIDWADGIVLLSPEPDCFFIELSLCGSKSVNDVVEFIGQIEGLQPNALTLRVSFGILFQKFKNNAITLEKLVVKIDGLNDRNILTELESSSIYQIEDDSNWYIPEEGEPDLLLEDVTQFLTYYKNLNMSNFEDWQEINRNIVEAINIEVEKNQVLYAERQKVWAAAAKQKEIEQQQQKRKKMLKLILFSVMVSIPFLFFFYLIIKYQRDVTTNHLWTAIGPVTVVILISMFRVIAMKADDL